MKYTVCLLLLSILVISRVSGQGKTCEELVCDDTTCCVTFHGRGFCSQLKQEGQNCGVFGGVQSCPCEEGLTCVDDYCEREG